MKKLRTLIGTTLSASLLLVSPMAVLAVTGTDTGMAETTTTTTVNTTKPTAEDAAMRAAEFKKRLEDNKAALKTKLDEKTKKIIIAKCKPAQIAVKGLTTSANAISTNRSRAYVKVSDRIQTLIDKVKLQGIDTTALEAANALAKQKATTLAASMATYEQTLSDLGEMDCVTDPTAFQATLILARTQREAVKTQAKDLQTYINTTLKDAIKAVRAQLQPTDKTGGTQ